MSAGGAHNFIFSPSELASGIEATGIEMETSGTIK